jgi:hypothetical protein
MVILVLKARNNFFLGGGGGGTTMQMKVQNYTMTIFLKIKIITFFPHETRCNKITVILQY